jgi:hypothetical protein
MANPIIPQGTLNRLAISLQFVSHPNLNITASYLGKEMASMTFSGVATTPLDTATGVVYSPEPYQRVTVMAHLVKSMALSQAWKTQLELNSLVGDLVVYPDVLQSQGGLNPYQISNTAIENVNPIRLDGLDATWTISFSGVYYVNSVLWNL